MIYRTGSGIAIVIRICTVTVIQSLISVGISLSYLPILIIGSQHLRILLIDIIDVVPAFKVIIGVCHNLVWDQCLACLTWISDFSRSRHVRNAVRVYHDSLFIRPVFRDLSVISWYQIFPEFSPCLTDGLFGYLESLQEVLSESVPEHGSFSSLVRGLRRFLFLLEELILLRIFRAVRCKHPVTVSVIECRHQKSFFITYGYQTILRIISISMRLFIRI